MTRPGGYVESYYLSVLADMLKQRKQRSYDCMHILRGHTVLDVGCGQGTDTLLLADLVGPAGRVIGIDHDLFMVNEAERRSIEGGYSSWCRHRRGEASALPLESNSVDASRCENLFQDLSQPAEAQEALAEMVRVTRPGGWVVVMETDLSTFSIDTAEVDIERRLVRFCAEHLVGNGYAGRHLYRLFKQQPLTDMMIEIHPMCITSYEMARYVGAIDLIEQEALAANVLTADELERLHKNLQQAEAEGTFFAHINTVLAAGRKLEPATK
ncbi:methyltransferase domain-containing protein [Ktedonosporobacter rubrisoli]|uniref:Methyltransferase domain-containing protein n=1 Tax=Ktedonosporobacter rubrisoli TaxID=2509675 RepID=A0A4P6K4Y0_KTERU|nr:methyltransferase domain-containing protein [Ktedonosporobacter rubrisoli]QBD83135.1 methyltransferase domain-containing protein [Ktedonosporobacter rubrisoli]